MNLTSLDFLLLAAVPVTVAVVGTVLWRLAVRRIQRRPCSTGMPPAGSPAWDAPPVPTAAARLVVHATADAPISPYRRH
jgi:hypothetical protein